jgi:hypothetical protein
MPSCCPLQALRVFDFYASLSAGDPFAMHLVAWGQLMMDTNVSTNKQHLSYHE